jgi:membrane protein YdbS with pleckstrin-like domain
MSEHSASASEGHATARRRLASRVRLQWALRLLVAVAVVAVGGWTAAPRLGVDPTYALAVAGMLALFGLVLLLLRYRLWVYQVRADALYLERGVLRHVRTVVPYVRIQHVDTSRGPVERALGLSTLVVYTAGSRGADVSIPGLTPEEASALQQQVKELAIEAEEGEGL